MKNRSGFTLLELMIVVAVVAIATALILPTVLGAAGNVKAALLAPVVLP